MDILSLGLDIASFDESKKKTLQEFVSMFDLLSKYDGKVINPVMGGGLLEFNKSIAESGKLLDQLQSKISNIGAGINPNTTSGIATLSNSIKELTALTSDEAKAEMALKLALSETSKELLKQSASQQTAIQQRINAIVGIQEETRFQSENNAMKLQAVGALRALANEQDRSAKAAKQSDAKNEVARKKDEAEADRQRTAALKAVVAQEELDAKAKAKNDKETKALLSDYEKLKIALKEQAAAYQNLVLAQGKTSPAAKRALADYAATASVVGDIDSQLSKASQGAGTRMGRVLGDIFGQLRMIAYILPGIGIAGIFTLAFEAIGNALSELDLFKDKTEQQIDAEIRLNKSLKEQLDLFKSISDQQEKLNAAYNTSSAAAEKRYGDEMKARGFDRTKTLNQDVLAAEQGLTEAAKKVGIVGVTGIKDNEMKMDQQKAAIDKLIEQQKTVASQLKDLNALLENPEYKKMASEALSKASPAMATAPAWLLRTFIDFDKPVKKQIEQQKARLEAQKTMNDEQLTNLTNYVNADQAVREAHLEREKAIEDERRKLYVETTKDRLAISLDANRKILSDDRSTHEERKKALKAISDLEKRQAAVERFNVTDNLSSTPTEKAIAQSKQRAEIARSAIKLNEALEKDEIAFYQRRLKATTEIRKAELSEEAMANERIFKNEQKSFDERLAAYNRYLDLRQKAQQLELEMGLQRGAKSANGKTSLTREEKSQLVSQTRTQEANIQADAEKQTYEILSTSLNKQLKLIEDTNRLEEENNKASHATQLRDLNKRFTDGLIKYREYKKAKEVIDHSLQVSGFDADVADDLTQIDRLTKFINKQQLLKDQAERNVANKQARVDKNESQGFSSLADKRELDEAIGMYNAYNEVIIRGNLSLKKAQEDLSKDLLAREKNKFQELERMEREHAANRMAIEEGVWNLVSTLIDQAADKRIADLRLRQDTIDEQYDSQIEAVERSSLSEKNKAALEIQLRQQKKESDKQAALEERKLKREQAVIDRGLALAHIAWSTEQAIMAALSLSFIDPISATALAIQRGVMGAISAATVLAVPLPSFATGVKDFEGGYARVGEAGPETIKEPYKSPYMVTKETIMYLPKGTDVIPLTPAPEFKEKPVNDGWDQTRWLAKQIKKNNQPVKFNPTNIININLQTELWRQKILGN